MFDSVRRAVGNDFPIWIKLNSSDLDKNGFTFEECMWVCDKLSHMGIDAIEVSGGLSISPGTSSAQPVQSKEDEGRFYNEAKIIAEKSKADIISVCGYRTLELIEEKLNQSSIRQLVYVDLLSANLIFPINGSREFNTKQNVFHAISVLHPTN